MKLEELAFLMGKKKKEIEAMLKESDVIELNLTEKNKSKSEGIGKIEIIG